MKKNLIAFSIAIFTPALVNAEDTSLNWGDTLTYL